MNKYKKALRDSVDRSDKNNYNSLKELVEKATPKRVENVCYGDKGLYKCYCGKVVGFYYDSKEDIDNYCSNCGQAIDRSEME